MKKLLLFVIACTLGLFTVNAQNRLESITQTNESNNITYVYEDGTNKVVEVREGVHNDEGGWQIVTFLTYNANGQLVSTERGTYYDEGGIDKESYYAPAWNTVEYTYTDGKLTSYVEKEFENWTLYQEACDIKTYTVNYEGDNVVEVLTTGQYYGESYNSDQNAWVWGWVDYAPTKRIYTYEDGKLVKEESFYYDQYVPGFASNNDPVTYAYNEAGNCVSATKYNGEITDYIYDLTKLATDVYSFAYPYEVKPANTNIIAKAETYRYETDWEYDEEKQEWVETEPSKVISADPTYNYSFATVAKPLAPAGLTAEVLSDTEVKLMWDVVADAASYNVYNGAELAGTATETETTFTVTGLTPETEYTFTVTAVNDGGESDASDAVTAKTLKFVEIAPEAVAFGEVTVGGEYWSKVGATREVSVVTFGKEVESITVDNAFFTLPAEIDLTADTITFAVGYDFNGTAGEQEGTITIALATDTTVTVPVTATAYAPVTPDVFELAQEITFTEGVYTDTPDFATLHDNYLGAPDAVYAFTLEDNQAVEVKVAGKNAKHAIYSETLGFENSVEREDKVLSTTFSYDFNDGNLDDFIVEDYDEYQDYTWELEEDDADGYYLVSYSFLTEYDSVLHYHVRAADERIYTKEAYPITEHSVLTMDININDMIGDTVAVEITKDGVNFTQVDVVCEREQYTSEWLSKRVNIGARMAELGLEFGEYQISLYHKAENQQPFFIDNLTLTERGLVYPAGNYYLVAAADSTFTVEVTSVDYTGDEEIDLKPNAPVLSYIATSTTDTTVVLTWEAVAGAKSYNVYNGIVLAADSITATTYTVTGLTAKTEYTFTVTAVNEAGESAASNAVTVTTLAAEPETPVDPEEPGDEPGDEPVDPEQPADTLELAAPVVVADTVTATTVTLSWNAVEGATSYNVYMDTVLVKNVTDTVYTVDSLTAETTYSFTVTAVADTLESVASNVVTVTTLKVEGIVENAVAFGIYPNPAVDRVVIETESTIESVSIYTLTGVMIYSEVDTNNTINVSDLNSGVYFIKVVTSEGESVQRFIKK